MTELAKLDNLRYLKLSQTDLTDVGLKKLTALKNLRSVGLAKTRVTEVGVNQFQMQLPKCKIVRDTKFGLDILK